MLNKIKSQNNYKYNISFGLNSHNQNVISNLDKNTKNLGDTIRSFDMHDTDIQPCLKEFLRIIQTNYLNSNAMIAIIEKLEQLNISIKSNKDELMKCLNLFFDYWVKIFKSTRVKVADFSDKIGIKHPDIGNLSRTITDPSFKEIATKNREDAYKYLYENVKKNECPDVNFLIELNKIITKDLEYQARNGTRYPCEDHSGIIIQSQTDKLKLYPEQIGIDKRLDKFMAWLHRNYNKDDLFLFCAQSYKHLLGISPFYDGNGRTIRAFIDAILYSKGYHFKQYPDNYAEVRNLPMDDLKNLFAYNCEKIPD